MRKTPGTVVARERIELREFGHRERFDRLQRGDPLARLNVFAIELLRFHDHSPQFVSATVAAPSRQNIRATLMSIFKCDTGTARTDQPKAVVGAALTYPILTSEPAM
ncbi:MULTISPECIES: hypothetical protein [unclassified Sphingomonas]|uniref:hypothetical protein n=1 Tax=unclassified Sphingomonas TaxID=196159 RepID=UPI0012E33651|nr:MULTISPECIES: hypothetical protein [unclassified Sphingomonas]